MERKTGLEPATLTLAMSPHVRTAEEMPDFTGGFEALRSPAVQSNRRCVGRMLENLTLPHRRLALYAVSAIQCRGYVINTCGVWDNCAGGAISAIRVQRPEREVRT